MAQATEAANTELDRLSREVRRLSINAMRYEKLRKATPKQFSDIYKANMQSGKPFDELVDSL